MCMNCHRGLEARRRARPRRARRESDGPVPSGAMEQRGGRVAVARGHRSRAVLPRTLTTDADLRDVARVHLVAGGARARPIRGGNDAYQVNRRCVCDRLCRIWCDADCRQCRPTDSARLNCGRAGSVHRHRVRQRQRALLDVRQEELRDRRTPRTGTPAKSSWTREVSRSAMTSSGAPSPPPSPGRGSCFEGFLPRERRTAGAGLAHSGSPGPGEHPSAPAGDQGRRRAPVRHE